ncbi:MAG TPA: glycosyltransferase family 2 protein [Candidatus Woesebacteria bacterium]|nr:glycosyltransferase family 2 protein [Candidatus Woesebacteria bacterium]
MNEMIDIIIPSFNGKYLLEKHLPEVFKNSDFLNKVIIIDNGSTDGTIDWLKENYPEVVIVKNDTNLGFTKPVNQGVAVSTADYLVLLNNDVHPEKGYLKDVLHFFKDEKVFAVSFNEDSSSWPQVKWDGKIQFTRGEDKSKPYYSAWASGGSAIFKRSIWNKLGGLNEIYAPFYWEDIDIGYRAWKMGYKIIWDNQSLVFHEHESTAKKINPRYLSLIKQRNELLFNWVNISDKDLLRSHRQFLFAHILRHPGYLKVFLVALWRFIIKNKKIKFVKTDREVLSLVNQTI